MSNYKLINLTKGYVAKVDVDDFNWINSMAWHVSPGNESKTMYYAVGCDIINGHRTYRKMHRLIMRVTDPKLKIDHINGDTLDNRKSNLRLCSHIDNMKNQRSRGGTSKYLGVSWNKQKNLWIAQIQVEGKKIYLGQFDSEEKANEAFKDGSVQYHGEFGNVKSR